MPTRSPLFIGLYTRREYGRSPDGDAMMMTHADMLTCCICRPRAPL